MPRPEGKGAGFVFGTGKRSRIEKLSLVEGCSQPTPTWSGQSRENEYAH